VPVGQVCGSSRNYLSAAISKVGRRNRIDAIRIAATRAGCGRASATQTLSPVEADFD
jgi:hypothetical protein